MKIATLNFSGNVGKSTVATHLLKPRIPNAEYIAVESINADEGVGEAVRGKQFGQLQEDLMLLDAAVVDIGASNVEDVMRLMAQYEGSHEDFDVFVVPATREAKQVRDTIATIKALGGLGVEPTKIRVVFNKLEAGEVPEEVFSGLLDFHRETGAFEWRPGAVIYHSELYQRLRALGRTVDELVADETDWKGRLREASDAEAKQEAAQMISLRRLALSAKGNLDVAFDAVMA